MVGSDFLENIPVRNILVCPKDSVGFEVALTDWLVIWFKGFLHGAYFSGIRAADEIRDLVRDRHGK